MPSDGRLSSKYSRTGEEHENVSRSVEIDRIRSLELKYETQLEDATTPVEMKIELINLITARRNTLNMLMAERKQATAVIAPSGKSVILVS